MNFLTFLIFSLIFLVTRNHSQSTILPDNYSLKSIRNFVGFVQQKFDTYPANQLSLSCNDADQFSKIYTDLWNLLHDSQTISTKSFNDYIKIFSKSDSLKDLPVRLIDQLGRRFGSDDNYVKYIVDSYGLLNSLVDLCTFASNCWRFFSLKLHEDNFNKLFFDFTKIIANKLKESHENNNLCNEKISLQRNLYSFTQLLMQKHIQEYILSTYAFLLMNKCYQRANTSEPEMDNVFNKIVNKFIINTQQYNQPVSKILNNLPQYIYQCDDNKEHVRDKTYFELEKMWQVFIGLENDLNTYKSCGYNCNFSKEILTDFGGQCKDILDCEFYTRTLHACVSSYDTSRRFKWIQKPSGNRKIIYGSNSISCSGKVITMRSIEGLTRDCDYCVCLCKGKNSKKKQNDVTAIISFRDQITNIYENMVVVGIRFVKKNYMIHVQIKEGKIRPKGEIEEGTLKWKKLENIEYNNLVYEPQIISDNGTVTLLSDGIGYGYPYMMNLDDLVVPDDFVVTGVRFRYVEHSHTKKYDYLPVELQIQMTPFDYSKGKLVDIQKSHWISTSQHLDKSIESNQTRFDRKELLLENPDIPIRSRKNVPDSGPDQFIKFRASDMRKDAGQTTVPFLDAQPVEGEPAFPLSGIGIFHKGSKGFGGFLSFRLYDLNLTNYIIPDQVHEINLGRVKREIPFLRLG